MSTPLTDSERESLAKHSEDYNLGYRDGLVAGMEAAAKVCEDNAHWVNYRGLQQMSPIEILDQTAAAIRAEAEKK